MDDRAVIDYHDADFPFRLPPYAHQLKVWRESRDEKRWALFMDRGTGKSKVTIDTIAWLWMQGEVDTVVYFAKKGEYLSFSSYEIPVHMPRTIAYDLFVFSSAEHAKGKLQEPWRKFIEPMPRRLRILVINIESLNFAGAEYVAQLLKTSKKRMMVVDESTCVKETKSARSKKAYFFAAKCEYRRILTGMPLTKSPLDLFGQCIILGREKLGFNSKMAFEATYAIKEKQYFGNRSFDAITGWHNLDDLNRRLATFSHTILKEDCLDLPPKVFVKKVVPLTEKQATMYKRLRDQALIDIEGHEQEVTNVLSQIIKLHQIVCGQLKVGEDEYVSIENERIPILIDLLEDFDGRVIVWATYRRTLADVTEALKKKFGDDQVVSYYGGVDDADRADAIFRFQGSRPIVKDGEHMGTEICPPEQRAKYFVANPQAAGFGITLTAATMEVYYSNSYNLEHRLQSEDRAHRIGQTKTVVIVDLVTPDTVDDRIISVLRGKKNLAHEVMNTPLSEWI